MHIIIYHYVDPMMNIGTPDAYMHVIIYHYADPMMNIGIPYAYRHVITVKPPFIWHSN